MESTMSLSDRVSTPRRPRSKFLVVAVACAAAYLVSASSALAQRFHSDPVDEQARRLSGFSTHWVRDPGRYSSERDRFDDYFTKAYFPSMTQYGPKDLEELGEKRYDLFNDFLWKTTNRELQTHLTELAFAAMKDIAFSGGKNYHPAVRYNAILVLGMLDKTYGDDRANRPPEPLPEANDFLAKAIAAAAQATAQNRAVPAYLVVGALIGLERHARFGDSLDPSLRDAMTASVRSLLANDPPLVDLERAVAEWIDLQGVTVLAQLGSPGANGEVHQTLLDLLAGKDGRKMTLDSRCTLAAQFAKFNYEGAQIDAQATADQFFTLVVDVAQAEAKRAKEFEDTQISGGAFGGGRSTGGRRRMGAYGETIEFDRRMLLARFGDLRSGLRALKPILPAEKQAAADAILVAITKATDAAEDSGLIDLDVAQAVRDAARAMERAANPAAAPAAEDVPEDTF